MPSAWFYASKDHGRLNGAPFVPESVCPFVMLNPLYQNLLDFSDSRDLYAFGGFCIIGVQPSLKPQFAATVRAVAPRLKKKGIKRAHLLGVCAHDCVQVAFDELHKFDVDVSTDGSGPEKNSINGRVWDMGYTRLSKHGSPWRQAFTKEQKKAAGGYHPAELSLENIRRYVEWMEGLGQPSLYDDTPERMAEGIDRLEMFLASYGPDRRRHSTFNKESEAKFLEEERRRKQLSMW